MTGLARRSDRPFLVGVTPRVCDCELPIKELSSHKQAKTAIANISGYWAVYVGFFGEQTMWLDFIVMDTRDGKVIWKNGRQLTEEDYGSKESAADSARPGRKRVQPGQWIGEQRRGGW